MQLYADLYDLVWRASAPVTRSPTVGFYDTLLRAERLPEEQLRQLQWRKLQALVAHAFHHVPFYRRRFEQLGARPEDIRTPGDYAKLPPLTRAELQEQRDELVASNIAPAYLLNDATGGSTGKPIHFRYDRRYQHWLGAIMRVQDGWAGLRRGDAHAFLWGAKIDLTRQQASFRARLTNYAKRTLFLDSFQMDDAMLRRYVAQLAAFRPRLLTGYVLSLQILARFIEREGLPVPAIGAVQTGAEPLREPQRRLIADLLRAPVFERYGGRDIGAIAHECEAHQGMHIFALNYYVECIRGDTPCSPGELGELLVTQLDNYGAPFLRYRSEDLGVLAPGACACSRSYPRLERVEGRILDVIVGMNGRALPGEFFPHFFKDFDIGEFQVIQKRRDLLEIKLVQGGRLAQSDTARISDTIRGYLGEATQVRIELVNTIERTASGKFRVTISEVPFEWTAPRREQHYDTQ
jgi:phenylacetate-CoA ligase